MRLRRHNPQPVGILRSWVGPDGEEWFALHPFHRAMTSYYAGSAKTAREKIDIVTDRSWEIHRGERRLPDEVAADMLEVDRQQRENGCPDENIAGLVELLQGAWTA